MDSEKQSSEKHPPQNIKPIDDVHLLAGWKKTRNSVTFKLFAMLFLLMISLIPVAFVQDLVRERQNLQSEATEDINQKWAGQQTIAGPILTLPYEKIIIQEKKALKVTEYLHILPEDLKIEGQMEPKTLHRGIYDMVVYTSGLTFSGHFNANQFNNLPVANESIAWDKAFVSVGIDDLRGIEETVELNWAGSKKNFDPGTVTSDLFDSGIHQQVSLNPALRQKNIPFHFDLKLKGNQKLYFTPVGQQTQVKLASNWPNPSFDGAFLPDQRTVDDSAFQANWKILHLNRNYPQLWNGKQYSLEESNFGVYLLQSVDHYQKVTRSVKYALFFIGLTFLIFFFVEILTGRMVHPLQYLLVGFALCVFYTLLLSISEHLGFDKAYLIAAIMTVILISSYAAGFLKSWPLTAFMGAVLSSLYTFIYVIIYQQDYALLIGSLGLFVVLALVMFFSRKLDLGGQT